jgi:hypothetical protein
LVDRCLRKLGSTRCRATGLLALPITRAEQALVIPH